MGRSSDDGDPVVETPPQGEVLDPTLRALHQRIRQQEILAELGVNALQGSSFEKLLTDTAQLTAEGLGVEFCKVLEHIPSENEFLVRAGVGWGPGIVGVTKLGADLASPAGFALRTGKAVISNHLENEERFRTPEMLRQHGIQRAMNVILQGDGKPYGVLEVDSRSEDEFVEHDLAFLQGAANILGMAIERERQERTLKAALERQEFLLKEMNHRVRNSLAIVASMLRLQAKDVSDEPLSRHLDAASRRISAVAMAHEQLYRGSELDRMDVGQYIEALCKDLATSVSPCVIHTQAQRGIETATDRAISCALIVNELITNTAKYAYPGRSGAIWVTVAEQGDEAYSISVRDEGDGLPPDFDPLIAKGLGMQIVTAFTTQLNGALTVRTDRPGVEFVITLPRQRIS